MVNDFQNFLCYLENQRKHSVVYFVKEVFLSSKFNNFWDLDQRDFV